MIRKFGFGDYTHVEVSGENKGIVPPVSDWSGSSVATISFGHGISTTPIALTRAYAAIANGGLLLRPRLVHALEDANGKVIYTYAPEIEHRVISEATAAKLRADPARGRRLRNRQPERARPGLHDRRQDGHGPGRRKRPLRTGRIRRFVHRLRPGRSAALRDLREDRTAARRVLRRRRRRADFRRRSRAP